MEQSSWLKGYRAFWIYTIARFALFAVIALLLWVVGVPSLFALLIAIVVSVPLSWFLLAKPRQAFAATIEARVSQRRERSEDLGKRLDDVDAGADDAPVEPDVSESPVRNRSKRR